MPIKKENRKRYPKNWKEISEHIRFERAGNKCEECGIPNYSVGYRCDNGDFSPISGNDWLDAAGKGQLTYKQANEVVFHANAMIMEKKYIVIVLTVAHLDHTPENCDPANLKAMCQRCHLNYDRKANKAKKAALNPTLF